MKLNRNDFIEEGIFGTLSKDDGTQVAATLEHAYQQSDGSWAPKIPDGTFTCVRGMHQLHSMTHPFETFEITNVPGHANILIHMGNFDKDSEGCVLVGQARVGNMVNNSVATFNSFIASMAGLNSFELVVTSSISSNGDKDGPPAPPTDDEILNDLKGHE